jgi:hypothetical protein
MKCMPMRYMPMRHTLVKWTPKRCVSMRHTPMKYTPTLREMYAYRCTLAIGLVGQCTPDITLSIPGDVTRTPFYVAC